MVNNTNNTPLANQLVLSYSSMDQLNYFLNTKIMQNVQRIVDERDSYLESIIELQQDKDYLSFKLNSSLANLGNNSSTSNEAPIKQLTPNLSSPNSSNGANNVSQSASNVNLNATQLAEGAKNAASGNLNETNLNMTSSSSLIELSDPQTLLVLIESIYKEIASANTIIESAANMKHTSEHATSSSDANMADFGESNQAIANGQLVERLHAINLENTMNSNGALLNDLKNRKLLANNWNQKIAIELVECKVKLRQLINEM